nr:molybdopterin-guanine dinucleotide biosynthesis protein B [Fodinibius sp.]NIV10535.1 hypothetical protein [Fodinibius sp.]NIY24146.1 hypothetical protein [Fodinibius sp.]
YRVGAFKHSTHHHPIDKIGSDSDRLRRAGGDPSLFHSQEGMAVFFNSQNSDREEHVLSMLYTDCDLVLVESFCSASGPKIVIINGEEELAELTNVIAVVNKSGRHPDFPAFSHDDPGLVEFIVQRMLFKALQG